MSSTNRRRGPGSDKSGYLLIGACLLVICVLALTWASVHLGTALGGGPTPPANPFRVPFALADGSYAWPGTWATGVLVALVLLLAAVLLLVVRLVRTPAKNRERVDVAARHMGRHKDLAKISQKGAEATAARLGAHGRGIFLGYAVAGNLPLYGSVEDTHLDIWGTRTGKTTSKAIPALMDHGAAPALATSNRRDIVDATRLGRADHGQVFVFDLQDLIGEPAAWWWNPLSYVTDINTATKMAEHFAADSRGPNSRTDAYFEPAGQELLANFLLAAALDGRPITQVYRWTADHRNDEPERILRGAGPDYLLAADSVRGVLNAPEKQRGGVYGTARQMASVLRNPQVAEWVTQPSGLAKRPEFSPEDFVRSTDTLYLISREGKDSAGALVTALTVAVCEAAERHAARSEGGRLPRELLAVLDEAANVCKWSELPNLYSHYGARGILLMTILQSWAQGVAVWGEEGMTKLWSSANISTYGGGVRDDKFLGSLAQSVGRFEPLTTSHSYQPRQGGEMHLFASGRSTSISSREEDILSVADLLAMPRGRALVFASGTRPTLMRTVPWWERDFAERVQASITQYDPGARP